jgi:PAS domain S-box-containing protein
MCYAGEELERFEETIMPALFENGRWQGEAVGRRADGSAFAQRLSLAALEGGNVVCVVRDISDERAAEREQRKRRRKTEALYTASSGLLKARDRDEVAARIMDLVSGTFGYPGMALRLVEDGRLVPAYVSPETADHMPERPALAVDGDSAVAQTFRSGQTAQVDDVRALDDPVDYGDARAAAGIPIADHGILTLMDDEVGGIDPFDLRLVEILTTHAAGVLDRIEREKDLRRSERRFRQVTETIDEVFWLRTREQTLYVSPSFERIWGRSRERLVEDVDAHLAWVHPDDRKAVASAYSALVDDGDSMDTTYRIKRPDGEVRWVDVQFEPVVAARAGGLRFAGVYRDITARRRYQQRLHQSEKTYREIIDEARDAIYVLDADGRFLDANASTAAMLEAGVDALIGLPLTSFLDPSRQDAETVDRHLHAALEGTPQRFKLWAQRSDGTAFPKEVRLQRGSYFGEPALICIARDITERTRRERRLREAKQEAESAARLKSAMLANMSHEVRTPMTNITGFAEVLAEETEGQAQHFAELIHDSGQRLMDTLSSVLQLSKLEAGTARLMRQTVDLAGLAEEIVHEEHTAAPRDRHLDLRLEIGARPAPVDGDPGALQSIIRNLVDNAIKFTGEGGRVTVRVDRVPEDDRVRLVVEDDGAGMSADFQERMFEAFRQEGDADHNPFQREHEGSGLGLAIVKRVVDLYDASIEVDSAPGEGTRIAVRFPPPAEGRPEGA